MRQNQAANVGTRAYENQPSNLPRLIAKEVNWSRLLSFFTDQSLRHFTLINYISRVVIYEHNNILYDT